ncbi:hypothetical protein [Bradyrhizobium sp. AZCC 1578]
MDVEIPHTAVKPKRQIIQDGERTGEVAGRTNLLDRKIHPPAKTGDFT